MLNDDFRAVFAKMSSIPWTFSVVAKGTSQELPGRNLLLGLEIVQQHIALLALLTPVSDNDTRAVDHLSRVALTVEHAEAGPFAQHLAIGHLDQRDLVFRAQRNDELLVGFFLAGLVENAHMCLATIESFGGFAQTAGKTVVDEGNAEDTFQGIEDRHGTGRSSGIARDFDFIGRGDGGSGLFSVRHFGDSLLVLQVQCINNVG